MLAYFGSSNVFQSDFGGEFENDIFKEMSEAFGIEISTTLGESPFRYRVVERSNKMFLKQWSNLKKKKNSVDEQL